MYFYESSFTHARTAPPGYLQASQLPPDPANGNSNTSCSDDKGGSGDGGGGFLSRTLSGYHRKGSGGSSSLHSSRHSSANGDGSTKAANGGLGLKVALGGRRSSGGSVGSARRPANGRAPGRRDPAAVARLEAEAEARRRAEQAEPEGIDRSWQLPTNVDYYTTPGEEFFSLHRLVGRTVLH